MSAEPKVPKTLRHGSAFAFTSTRISDMPPDHHDPDRDCKETREIVPQTSQVRQSITEAFRTKLDGVFRSALGCTVESR